MKLFLGPKEFSVKGGMGAALAANIENAKEILTTLVTSLSIPVTCKIRIRSTAEETIEQVRKLQCCSFQDLLSIIIFT